MFQKTGKGRGWVFAESERADAGRLGSDILGVREDWGQGRGAREGTTLGVNIRLVILHQRLPLHVSNSWISRGEG